MPTMPVTIEYNQDFDREHYPFSDWHRETVAKIAEHFKIPMDVAWWYDATLQGAIFTPKTPPTRLARLMAADVAFLNSLPGFRWIEALGPDFKFGLAHKQPR